MEHEVPLDLGHADPPPLTEDTLCKVEGPLHWLVWVEPLEHLLHLVLCGVVYLHLHVHPAWSDEGRIQPEAEEELTMRELHVERVVHNRVIYNYDEQ